MCARLAAGLLVLAACVAACGRGEADSLGETSGPGTDDGPVFVRLDVAADEEPFPAAIMSGELRIVEGCLMLGQGVPAWTADFSWDAEARVVSWPGGELAVGETGRFGGGAEPLGSSEHASLLDNQGREAVTRCVEVTGAEHWTYLTPSEVE